MLILDGYSGHIQYKFLNMMKEIRVVVIALPSQTSHVLQPLDVSVFGPYKNYLQAELHRVSRIASKLTAFSVAVAISNAYLRAFVAPNIRSGFVRCGVWDEVTRKTNVKILDHLFVNTATDALPLEFVLESFKNKERSLLRDVDVEEDGRIKIDTSAGANVTAAVVLEALKKRNERKEASAKKAQEGDDDELADKNEGKQALQRYSELADRRHLQRKRLRESRGLRRQLRARRALDTGMSANLG